MLDCALTASQSALDSNRRWRNNLVCIYWHRSAQSGWNGKRQGGKWVGRRGNGGKVPLGQLFLMMSVGCMQREVQIGRRRAEIFAKNSKIKPAPPRPKKKIVHGPLAHWKTVKDAP